MGILEDIKNASARGEKRLALLLDPEKACIERLPLQGRYLPDYLFVGGSTGGSTASFVARLRERTMLPIVLFPGMVEQFTPLADALLFLSVLSGRNAEMLVGRQVRAARAVKESGIESIAMGYILIDGGRESSVVRATGTRPIAQTEVEEIVDTAIAAELLGKSLVYLEAGSGAQVAVNEEIIRRVRSAIDVPIIVGGGIRTPERMREVFAAGADIVVIGNHFEKYPDDLQLFCKER